MSPSKPKGGQRGKFKKGDGREGVLSRKNVTQPPAT